MFIETYRNDVQETYDALLRISDPPERKEMDACVRGDLNDFQMTYCDGNNNWTTWDHRQFYHACCCLKEVEEYEYKRAMQWVPA